MTGSFPVQEGRSTWVGVICELSGAFCILAYHCRGHGKSGKPAGPYSVEQYAQDLAELFDHLAWPSGAVAGCSLSGCVAQAFGGLYPVKTTALGLIDTTARYGADAPEQWRERAEKARANGLGDKVDFQLSRWLATDRIAAELRKLLV